jgi:hypothetical protein
LVPKFHVPRHASHAAFPIVSKVKKKAFPMVTLKVSPYTNVILTFDFEFGLDHPVHEGYECGSPTLRRKKVNVKQRNKNLVMGPIGGPAPRRTD